MINRKRHVIPLIFLAISLAGIGYVYHLGQVRQAALLTRIRALESRVAANNQLIARANHQMVRTIKHSTCRNHNQSRDQQVLRISQLIVARSQDLVDTLELIKRQLREPGTAILVARQLPAHLARHTAFLRKYAPEIPTLSYESAPESGGWWARLISANIPVTTMAATLTQLTAQVRRYEKEALWQQAEKVNSHWNFTRIEAVGLNASNVLAPGSVGEAQLFLAEAFTGYNTRMMANGNPVPIQPNGAGTVEFKVPAAQPNQPDTVQAQWHSAISLQTCPTDTVVELDVPYLIVKRPTR